MLPHGENTEIGEKGINLSGKCTTTHPTKITDPFANRRTKGSFPLSPLNETAHNLVHQARVSLARAAYSGANIVLMDDSLSAVDAYVGKSILENCLLSGPLADKTRVLVTHALHVLDKVDYIYVMDNGKIAEQGTFTVSVGDYGCTSCLAEHWALQELMADSVLFSRVMEEYGSQEQDKDEKEEDKTKEKSGADSPSKLGKKSGLMQAEERVTGSVSSTVYVKYLRYAGGLIWAPIILTMLAGFQGSSGKLNALSSPT